MSISKIKTGSITTDAITEAKVADAAIENEHLNSNVVIGQSELAEAASSNDILLVYDASAGTLKKILASNVGTQAVTLSSISPTNITTGDGTGNATFTITGTNLTGATATLITSGGTEVEFDSVTVDSSTQITGVIAISSLSNANEPYDVKVYGSNGLQAILRNQINIDAQPVYTTASGSLGDQTVNIAGSFSVNATDPESAGNVTFELQSGTLPPGYSLTNTAAEGGTAIISGTDSTTSSNTTYNFTLRAVDAASNTTSRAFSITSRVPVSESFTSSGTFSVPSGITQTDVLVVAGGASGASVYTSGAGGGGGAGGLIFIPNYPITPGGTISVTVGCGGNGRPSSGDSAGIQGQDSSFGSPGDPGLSPTASVLTAKGGGYAGPTSGNGGGSGGGGSNSGSAHPGGPGQQPTQPGQSGAYGFGNPGGTSGPPGPYGQGSAGGGGGAGAAGSGGRGGQGGAPNGGNGGTGKAYTIADGTTPVYYAGGGGGGSGQTPGGATEGVGGQGGGTPGTSPAPATFTGQTQNVAANKGGGSGGTNSGNGTGAGGKGVVIVRY
jgi:hypothetical protein